MKKPLIFLIDDDEDEQDIFAEALQKTKLPFEFRFVNGVREALSTLTHIIPDYIFIDMNMPDINGLDGINMIKQIQPLHAVPVILYTTGANQKLCDEALAKGAIDCIKKSDSIHSLSAMLSNILYKA